MTHHSVEKIGGTSMNDYVSVRDNIVLKPRQSRHLYQRILVVSAYGGMTDKLLEHKKTGQPGIYGLFANNWRESHWLAALQQLKLDCFEINHRLFARADDLNQANAFIGQRLDETKQALQNLQGICRHGHFNLQDQLATVREMLASLGEAHSAWNTVKLLQGDGIRARLVDLTGWNSEKHMALDERIEHAFRTVDLETELPIVTGYAHSKDGLMSTFDRGYSEMTFSRIAVLTQAREAVIHKEFHLSSADPRLVGENHAVPIGRTNYDVADQLANLGMEAIHPKAAKGLRQNDIPLRVKNTFEPEHKGTLITGDYVSETPRVEIIAGCQGVYAIEVFDQDMAGNIEHFDQRIMAIIGRSQSRVVSKDINANTITHYLQTNLNTVRHIQQALAEQFAEAEIRHYRVAIVSAIGSDMKIPGILAKTVAALAEKDISVLAMHQSIRQVDMQFMVNEEDYAAAIKSLHCALVEVHDHGEAICLAS